MEFQGPRYNPAAYREAAQNPLTEAVVEEIANVIEARQRLQLVIVRLGGLVELIKDAEDAKKATERRNRPAA